MNYLDTAVHLLRSLSHQLWVRDLAALVVVSALAYLPAWVSSRFLRKRLESPRAARSRILRVSIELVASSLWPLWAMLFYSGFGLAIRISHLTTGHPFRVLPVLCFFLLFRILIVLTKEFLPPGDRRRRIRRGVIPLLFLLATLQQLGLLGSLLGWLDYPFLTIHATKVSVLSILFALGLLLAFFVFGKLLASFFRTRFLPGFGLDRTLSESLATLLRYALVTIGFFVALDSLGIDLTTLKIILGALGIGIGFGLQTVVNNMVSGLIILIERTVKLGDIVVVGGTDGRVIKIGLRSSVVRTRAGHDIIVPNSDLVTTQVTNFSYRDRLVRVDIPVGVSYAADPNQVRDIFLEAAKEDDRVLDLPRPDVIFMGYGSSSLDFQLRAWIDDPWQTPQVRSALYFSIWYKLKTAGIEVPFPQRDLHMRSGELRVRMDRLPTDSHPKDEPERR